MQIDVNLTLMLPRDELSIPVVRHLTKAMLGGVGVDGDCVADIELALTEACTNVLDHSRADDAYEVSVSFDTRRCLIGVTDTAGVGFDHAAIPRAADDAESGRGIHLMQELVDRVSFRPRGELGSVVQLEKMLRFDPQHPVRVADARRTGQHPVVDLTDGATDGDAKGASGRNASAGEVEGDGQSQSATSR